MCGLTDLQFPLSLSWRYSTPCRTGWMGGAALRIFIFTIALSGAGCAEVVMPLPEGVCEVSRSREFFSPGKTRKVVMFDRRCGSGVLERQVSVLEAAAALENAPGNVLTERVDRRARERLAQLEMSWTGEEMLTISRNPSMIVAKFENRASGVEITHLVRARDEDIEEFQGRRPER